MRNPSKAVTAHFRLLNLLCLAILGGVVIFAGVVWFLLSTGTYTPPEGIPAYLGSLLNLVALVALLKAHFLPRFFRPPPRGAPEEGFLAWHRLVTLIAFALREGGAFAALVGALLTGRPAGGMAVAGLAIVAMVLAWPREDQLPGA